MKAFRGATLVRQRSRADALSKYGAHAARDTLRPDNGGVSGGYYFDSYEL